MSENTTGALVHWETGTYWVRRVHRLEGPRSAVVEILQQKPPRDGAQDFTRETEIDNWFLRHTILRSTPAEAVEAGLEWVREGHEGEVSLEWVQESLFPLLVSVAADAGLDSSGWSFDQHAGLSWTIMDKVPDQGLRRLGIWGRWQQARFGIEGMIEALREIRYQRDLTGAAAPASPPGPAPSN